MRHRLLVATKDAGANNACVRHITVEEQPSRAEWEARCKVEHKAGKKQIQCTGCGCWFWPHEWKAQPILPCRDKVVLPAADSLLLASALGGLPGPAIDTDETPTVLRDHRR